MNQSQTQTDAYPYKDAVSEAVAAAVPSVGPNPPFPTPDATTFAASPKTFMIAALLIVGLVLIYFFFARSRRGSFRPKAPAPAAAPPVRAAAPAPQTFSMVPVLMANPPGNLAP